MREVGSAASGFARVDELLGFTATGAFAEVAVLALGLLESRGSVGKLIVMT